MIEPGTDIRFTGGRYNGFQGTVMKACDTYSSVRIVYEGRPFEVVEANVHMAPLAEWLAQRSETERALKGNPAL